MTIKELTYLLWRHLEGGNIPDDSRFTYRELRAHIKGIVFRYLKANYFEGLNSDEYRYGDDGLTTLYTVKVNYNDPKHGNLPYLVLPAKPMSLPGNRNVVISEANRISKWSKRFVPVRQEEVFVGSLQPNIPDVIQYYRSGTDMVFYNGPITDKELNVTIKYSLPEDDNVDIGVLNDYQHQIIIDAVRLVSGEIKPTDINNDGTHLEVR